MSKFLIINRTTSVLQVMVPPPDGMGHDYACISIGPSMAFDVMPIAGSRDICMRIPRLLDWKLRNIIDILEE